MLGECEKHQKMEPAFSLHFDELAQYLKGEDFPKIEGQTNSYYRSRESGSSFVNVNNFNIYTSRYKAISMKTDGGPLVISPQATGESPAAKSLINANLQH